MKKSILIAMIALSTTAVYASEVDWTVCKADLESTGCSKEHDDHEKHECLEKKGKKSVSKECLKYNHGLEEKFKGHHKKHGKHKH